MITVQQANKILEEEYSLKMIAEAYTEISVVKLQRIRQGIERDRVFFDEIAKVFRSVKLAATKKGLNLSSQKRNTVSILVTSNHRFYGDIESQLIRFFITDTTKILTDRIVVGKTGVNFLKGMQYFHPYTLANTTEDIPTQAEIGSLAESIKNYEKVLIYFNKFQTVLIQKPTVVDITSSISNTEASTDPQENHNFDYIFEPEIQTMLNFFENHIATLLIEQAFLEAELARTASRLISMDRAQGNADELIKQQKKVLFQAKKTVENVRLLETIASLPQFRKEKDG